MKSGRKNGLKAKKEEADAASYLRCCRSGMVDEGCIQQAILCANVKTSLVTSRVPSLAGVVYVRCGENYGPLRMNNESTRELACSHRIQPWDYPERALVNANKIEQK